MADKGSKRTVAYTTSNSQGNTTTQYSDGAYRYSYKGSEGQTTSNYFNDGKGHGFTNVNSSGTRGSENYKAPYSHSTNYNAGTRTYNPKK